MNARLKFLELNAQREERKALDTENQYLLDKWVKDAKEHARDQFEIAMQYDRIVKEINEDNGRI